MEKNLRKNNQYDSEIFVTNAWLIIIAVIAVLSQLA